MSRIDLVALAQAAVAEVLKEGAWAVDATVGNGHDTLFLARAVGAGGRVFGFDIQEPALKRSRARLGQAGLLAQFELFHSGHEWMGQHLPEAARGRIGAVMFNLGYLPGSDKERTTALPSTLAALETALGLLAPGGRITLLAYTGHPGGAQEAEGIKRWLNHQPLPWTLTVPPNRRAPPELIVIHKP